jgi:hypothetical protein
VTSDQSAQTQAAARFRVTLIRVLIVQAVSLVLLGLIQVIYNT